MTVFLLDSTVHIHWIRHERVVLDWLKEAIANDDDLLTSAVSVSEVYAGAHPRELFVWRQYFSGLSVVGVDHGDGVVAGRLRYDLARQGRQLHVADSLIAATALERRATVVTANTKDFAITGVPVLELAH